MKYLLALLSLVATLFWGSVVFAEEVNTLSAPIYQIEVLGLPFTQEPTPIIDFKVQVSASTTGETQANISVDDCGEELTLWYQDTIDTSVSLDFTTATQIIPVSIYRDSIQECVLTFSLKDTEKNLLASTQVGLIPQCPSLRATQPIDTDIEWIYNDPSKQTTTSQASPSTSKPSSIAQEEAELLSYTTEELNTSFSLLVEKGLLNEEEREKLHEPLTRMDAATLFVQIALSQERTVDTKKECNFADMQGATPEEIRIAQLACQMNIMGVHPNYTALENFMPEDIIPSEQLVTAFSRLLRNAAYETPSAPLYYTTHLQIAKDNDLINVSVVGVQQNLADLVIILGRATDKEYVILAEEILPISVKEKSGFRFW